MDGFSSCTPMIMSERWLLDVYARETGEPYKIENRLKDGKTGSIAGF